MPYDVTRNMGPSKSQSHTLEAIGHAEDFSPIITRIDPESTFFISEFSTGKPATQLDFGWMTEGLEPPGVNAHLEKEDYVSKALGSLEAKKNYCQFFLSSGYVTEAQRKVTKIYNEKDEYARLMKQTFAKHARDIEYAITSNTISRGESGTTPAMTGGVPFFMQVDDMEATLATGTGVVTCSGGAKHGLRTGDFVYFTADTMPTGLQANKMYWIRQDTAKPEEAFTIFDSIQGAVENIASAQVKPSTAGTNLVIVKNNVVDLDGAADFTLDDINNCMQMAYNRGGNPTVAVMAAAKKRRFSELVMNLTNLNVNRPMTKSRKLDVVADVYETDFGVINAKVHRMCPETSIYLMDMEFWKHRWFDPTHQVKGLAKKGSYDEFVIASTYGLEGTQPKASAAILNVKR